MLSMRISPDTLVMIERKPGEPATVILGGGDFPLVRFGPYPNPALAEQDAHKIKDFLAALVVGLRSTA